MSLFHPINLVCPSCQTLITMAAVGSVNADRRPDLRTDIMEDRFQDVTCGSCGSRFRLPPEFNLVDVGRGQWIASLPAARMPDYLAIEDEVSELFATSYGARAPLAAQAVGDGLAVRLTFGWPAIREKLLVAEHGFDDVLIEVMKLEFLRRTPSAPLSPGIELRFARMIDDMMVFAWIETSTEAAKTSFAVARTGYDAIAANAGAWAATRARLLDGPFVDMQKLYMGSGRQVPRVTATEGVAVQG